MAAAQRNLATRLTAKAGPLPVWAWAVLILSVGYLVYRRSSSAGSGADSQTTAVPVSSSASGGDTGAVGGSGSVSDMGSAPSVDYGSIYATNAGTIDALTNALVNLSALEASSVVDGGPPGAVSQNGPAASPTGGEGGLRPDGTRIIGADHTATQTQPGRLQWGGQTFTTKAGFDAWAKAHQSSTRAELARHPQARQVYGTLR